MPPSAANSASIAAARRSARAGKATQQVIEIDDSSDDGGVAPVCLSRPVTAASPRINGMSGSSGPPNTHHRTGATAMAASRRTAQAFVDDSATDDTLEDAPTQPKGRRVSRPAASIARHGSGSSSLNTAEGSSNGTSSAFDFHVAASGSTAGTNSKPEREPSTSATEDSSGDDAPAVASSSRGAPSLVSFETNNSNGRISRNLLCSSGSSAPGIGDNWRDTTRSTYRIVPDPSVAPSAEPDSESPVMNLASTAPTTAVRARTKPRTGKRATEPEISITTTKRSINAASGTLAGPSTISTRTRSLRDSPTSGRNISNANSSAVAPSRTSDKGKGRALQSSVEPASNLKSSRKSYEHTSPRVSNGEVYSSSLEELQDHPSVSPGFTFVGSTSNSNDASISKVATKVIIKPTDLSEELECAICADIMISPVNLICGHTFCDACVGPWLATHEDCPTCRTEMKTKPVRSYFADRVIKKYLESVYASLEAEGKHKEARTARQARFAAEMEAETARMKAAAEKNRRESAAAAVLAAAAARVAPAGIAGGPPPWRFDNVRQNPAGLAEVPVGGRNANGGDRAARARAARLGRARLGRAHFADAAALAARNIARAEAAQARHEDAEPVPVNNAGQFGNLLQQRDGALHVDPAVLEQSANEMGVPMQQLLNIMLQG